MPPALQFLVLTFAGWVNRHQDDLIAYLREENRVLREHLGPRPLRLTDAQRRRLAVRGQKLGRREVVGKRRSSKSRRSPDPHGSSTSGDLRTCATRPECRRWVSRGLLPAGDLICVFVRLNTYGADRFYVLLWPELQRVLINGYRDYLESHGGRRPKRADSFHTALRETPIEPFLDNWSLFDAFTEVSKTDPGTPGGPSAPH